MFYRTASKSLIFALDLILDILSANCIAAAIDGSSEPPARINYLTFAQGALPVAIGGAGAAEGFSLLASVVPDTHPSVGMFSELAFHLSKPVLWIRVRLAGGIDIQRLQMFFEFGEIIGNGTQDPVPMSERFSGAWRGQGVHFELKQAGPLVSGCYDSNGDLQGTVSGRSLNRQVEVHCGS